MKIKIEVENPTNWSNPFSNWIDPFFRCINKSDIIIVKDNSADFYVKPANLISSDDLKSGKKWIALEKRDGADIGEKTVLKHPSVVRYVKQYKLKDYNLNNRKGLNGRSFVSLLTNQTEEVMSSDIINKEHYNKIHLGWNFLHYNKLQPYLNIVPKPMNDRRIDVFFAGSTLYGDGTHKSGNEISKHRLKCLEILRNIKNINTLLVDGRKLSSKEYFYAINNSKIIISPWGWGEICYRDYEAILSGCILIKPKTDFINSMCKICDAPYPLWTHPDFSNLRSTVENILQSANQLESNISDKRSQTLNAYNQLQEVVNSIFEEL